MLNKLQYINNQIINPENKKLLPGMIMPERPRSPIFIGASSSLVMKENSFEQNKEEK